MPIIVKPSGKKDITKISCCECGERIKGVGLAKDSIVIGLQFKCKKCGRFCEVEATAENPKRLGI